MRRILFVIVSLIVIEICYPTSSPFAADMPVEKTFTNSIGMQFTRIEAGAFRMGGDEVAIPDSVTAKLHLKTPNFDERPARQVTIGQPFYMGLYEVTNEQYESFDPDHKSLRGKLGYSKNNDEAVVFVSWFDAVRFCEWLSKKEGLPYRLPTEAEWEYACRAGSTGLFHDGFTLTDPNVYKFARVSWYPDTSRSESLEIEIVPLTVGQYPANPWGLFDMLGNVEEWCNDWYGPYEAGDAIDPVGREDGQFRVTRGGSHSTELVYLRSANRMANLPEDQHWLIGFRVALGLLPETKALPAPAAELYQQNVNQAIPAEVKNGPDPKIPYFKGPRKYVKVPGGSSGPMYAQHNHDPALTDCPNGDLLAIWYSCVEERGRELCLLASRLRFGMEEWEPASPFWDVPDRNDHAPAIWFDGDKTIYQFGGLSAAATWGNLATMMRTSTDSGATWSKARLIIPEHGTQHMPIESVFRMKDGTILLPCDAVTGGSGGTVIHLSSDTGNTWTQSEGFIAGIHAGVVELSDGRLMALGRGDDIDGRLPMSLSSDRGKTWTRKASPFQPIGGGQRLALIRLQEGPIFLASFAHEEETVIDVEGNKRSIKGLYAALSYDDGETWTIRRAISDDQPAHPVESTDGVTFMMSASQGEPRGYLSVCQAQNGVIHLIGSRQHYAFNLAWLEAAPPAEPS